MLISIKFSEFFANTSPTNESLMQYGIVFFLVFFQEESIKTQDEDSE
nr:MAG TPA: hypothetical protein [Caudoviricetes sp.]